MKTALLTGIAAGFFVLATPAALAGNTSTNTSNNTSNNSSSDPWSSNSSSNNSSNQSGWEGRVDDYRRDERIDTRGDGRQRQSRRGTFEEYRTESGGWRRIERTWSDDDD